MATREERIVDLATRVGTEIKAVRGEAVPYDDSTPPTTGQTLEFDGTNFVPADAEGDDLGDHTMNQDLITSFHKVRSSGSSSMKIALGDSEIAVENSLGDGWAFTGNDLAFRQFNGRSFTYFGFTFDGFGLRVKSNLGGSDITLPNYPPSVNDSVWSVDTDGVGGWLPKSDIDTTTIQMLEADVSVNNSTSIVQILGFQISLFAGLKVTFEGIVYHESDSAADIVFEPDHGEPIKWMDATTGNNVQVLDENDSVVLPGNGAGNVRAFFFKGTVLRTSGLPSALTWYFAQNSAHPSDAIIKAGSYIQYTVQDL